VRFLPDYVFDQVTGLWRHRLGPVEPALRLDDVRYDPETGAMCYPRHDVRAVVAVLDEHLQEAEKLAAERDEPDCTVAPAGLRDDFEALRWFELPAACLAP
jgi:hypothetical protein